MLYMMMSRITRSIYIHTHIHTYSHSVYTVFEDIVGVVCVDILRCWHSLPHAHGTRERVNAQCYAP